ncbi:thioredoxin-like protein [Aspergillus aurantiobrunneus]
MPIISDFQLPSSVESLDLPADNSPFFLSFHASPDPNTGKPWCPDVVAALPHLHEVFSGPQSPQVAFINVGQRPEWKDLSNVYRSKWNVSAVPSLVRYERVDGQVKEVGRLSEGQILDRARLSSFVGGWPVRI